MFLLEGCPYVLVSILSVTYYPMCHCFMLLLFLPFPVIFFLVYHRWRGLCQIRRLALLPWVSGFWLTLSSELIVPISFC